MARVGRRTSPGRFTLGSWRDLEAREVQSALEQQVIATERITVVRCVYREGADFPDHFHPQEQITIVEDGALEFVFSGEAVLVRKGEMITIAPQVHHGTRVPEGTGSTVALNLFLKQPEPVHGFLRRTGVSTFLSPAH